MQWPPYKDDPDSDAPGGALFDTTAQGVFVQLTRVMKYLNGYYETNPPSARRQLIKNAAGKIDSEMRTLQEFIQASAAQGVQ